MQMDNKEIALNYKMAKNKKKQVEVLAELNLCGTKEIEEILIEEGLLEKKTSRPRRTAVKQEALEVPKADDNKAPADNPTTGNEPNGVIHNLNGLMEVMEHIESEIKQQEKKIGKYEQCVLMDKEEIATCREDMRKYEEKILKSRERIKTLSWQYQAVAECVKNGGRYE